MTNRRDEAQYAQEALRSITGQLERLAILQRPRSIAIYNYVAVAEFDALLSSAADPVSGLHHSHRRFVESSTHVIPRIFATCEDRDLKGVDLREDQFFREAQTAFQFGHKFDSVAYAYELANRGQFRLYVAKFQPRISFTYASGAADQADSYLRAAESLAISSPKGRNEANNVDELLNELRQLVRAVKQVSCEYDYSDHLLELATEYGREKLARTNKLELPEDNVVLGMSVRELRALWAAIMSLSDIHIAAHWIGDDGLLDDLPINTIVLCKPAEEFLNLLSRISGLEDRQVTELLQILTYDPAVASDIPILQPFLPLFDGRLCLPSSFVNGNNFERNFQKLLHRHPRLMEFAADFVARLEPTALESLEERFPPPQYRVMRQVRIPDVTDIDLLVWEAQSGFALAIQHKWPIGPDALRESISNDEKLINGASQARISCEYLRRNRDFVRAQLGLAQNDEVQQVEGVVVCRGLDGTGFLQREPNIPIITEFSFVELFSAAEDLPTLWKQLVARPDHLRTAARASDIKTKITLSDYEFVLPGLAVEVG